MKILKTLSIIFLLILVSCGIRNYDYYKFSKLEKKGFKLKIDSKDYSLSNTILDKENISEIKIDKKNKQRSLDNFISLISFKKGKIWKFLKAKIFWSSLLTSKRM